MSEIEFYVRHMRLFVNFLAEPNLDGEELDLICSNLNGKIAHALVEDPAIDKLALDVEVGWSNI
ncbi:MAG: hypothetical protein ACXABE_17045, partial [Candidatus Thorarchaeota archaeon]